VAIYFHGRRRHQSKSAFGTGPIAGYSDKYWDAVVYHQYPPQSTGDFSQWMADENAVLASKSSAYVTGYLAPLNPPGTKFSSRSFCLERRPGYRHFGDRWHALRRHLRGRVTSCGCRGCHPCCTWECTRSRVRAEVNAANSHYIDAQNAYNQGTTIDTLTLNFGYYLVAQPLGLAVLKRRSTERDAGGFDAVNRRRDRAGYRYRADSGALRAGVHQRHRPAQRRDLEQERDGRSRRLCV